MKSISLLLLIVSALGAMETPSTPKLPRKKNSPTSTLKATPGSALKGLVKEGADLKQYVDELKDEIIVRKLLIYSKFTSEKEKKEARADESIYKRILYDLKRLREEEFTSKVRRDSQ